MSRLAGCVALFGAVAFLAACGSAAHRSAALYTRAATASCLLARSNAVAGLPPTTPPSPPVVFVDTLRYDDYSTGGVGRRPGPHTQLGAWTSGKTGSDGIILSFFRSARAARSALKTMAWLYRDGTQARNVVATWDQQSKPRTFRHLVLGCLRAHTSGDGQTHSAPPATLATFAGRWGGHDRGLRITAKGLGHEYANASCCVRVYAMKYRILAVHGTVTHATADIRVTAYRTFPSGKRVKRREGELGKLVLENGILTNRLTRDYFCSEPAWGATGACGA